MSRFALVRTLYWTLLLNVLVVSCAIAAVPLTVGDTTSCDFNDLQVAINNPNAVTTVIRVKANYAGKPIHIDHGGYFVIAGGYPDCNPNSTPIPFNGILENLSILDGSLEKDGHGDQVPQPVISVSGGSSALSLSNFQVRFGNNSGHDGGGIRYETVPGDDLGHLELNTVDVHHNAADHGGGIFFRGNGTTNELILSHDSYIEFNTADSAGGGIRLEGNTVLTAASPQTTISNNTANPSNAGDGLGGGLQVLDKSNAFIGSPGFNGRAVIEGNHARFGGGIAINGLVTVHLYMTQAGNPARVEYNDALINGGGVYISPDGADDGTIPSLCGFNVGINHNSAQDGAAVYARNVDDFGPKVDLLPSCAKPPGAIDCAHGTPCNSIDDNTASAVGGAVVSMNGEGQADFHAERIELRRNSASHILKALDEVQFGVVLSNCLIAENTLLAEVIRAKSATVDGCTVTNNNIFPADVFSPLSGFTLANSIVWEPGHVTIAASHPSTGVLITDSIIGDAGSLDANIAVNNVRGTDPMFVHPAGGNYQLKNLSPAIDYTNSCDPDTLHPVDLISHLRRIALRDSAAPCDIGAYERQFIPASTFPSDEKFNVDSSLDLPKGWVEDHHGTTDGWFIVNDPVLNSFTAHAIDSSGADAPPGGTAQSDSNLITPPFLVNHLTQLTFDHRFNLEGSYDGAVLEISIAGSAFTEITAAGGRFVTGGYNGVLLTGAAANPIELECRVSVTPRMPCLAWTGGNGPNGDGLVYSNVVVDLPAAAVGQMVQLLWRVGSDGNGPSGYQGYYLDNVHVGNDTDSIFRNGFGPPSTDP